MDYINATDSELEQLVQQKDINAICELGERYLYGKNGHEKQYSLAYKMFHKGEKQGDKRAYKGLGDIYHNGWYMIKNEELAKEYYQKAGISVVPNGYTTAKLTEYCETTAQCLRLYRSQSKLYADIAGSTAPS